MLLTRDRYLKDISELSGTTREEIAMIEGSYYATETKRTGVGINDTYYTVVTTGSKQVTLEDLVIMLNFSAASDGQFDYEIHAFVDGSNKNTWSFSGGVQVSLGSPLNTAMINNASEATITVGAVVTLAGTHDYLIYASSHYVDTSSNRESITDTKNSFFTNDRRLIVPPNTSVLFESKTGGDAVGTVDIASQIFTIESEA